MTNNAGIALQLSTPHSAKQKKRTSARRFIVSGNSVYGGVMIALGTAHAAPRPMSIPANSDDAQVGQAVNDGPFGFLNGISRSSALILAICGACVLS